MEIEPGEIKDEIKNENDETENKKEDQSEPIFNKPLFEENNSKIKQGQSSIFEQKLFPKNESKQNKVDENKINIIPESNINPLFNNSEQTKETFLKNNISLIPPSNEVQTTNTNNESQNSELPSAVFGNQGNSNSNLYKTLNEMVTDGEVYNADSAKKTQTNPINVFNALNPDLSNENSNLNNINNNNQMKSLNKGVNPFKPNEP